MTTVDRAGASSPNGSRVLMLPSHPHEGRTGVIRKQPDEAGAPLGMYLIEFDDTYAGSAYALRRDFTVIKAR